MREFERITFDCYGTLIDWEGGITEAFTGLAEETGQELDPERLIDAYHDVEARVEADEYRLYREVLTEAAERVAERIGIEIPDGEGGFLARSLPEWQPFPDTNPALERLVGADFRLGIVSNIDDDLLHATLDRFTVDFDLLITAQQVGGYKPAPDHFFAARRQIRARPWIHAAQSFFHDIEPARALGIPYAWINRKDEEPLGGVRPEREFPDLAAFAEWMVSNGTPG